MRKKKQEPRFKEGDVVRITFVAEVVYAWHDPLGKPCYNVDPTVGYFPEECLEIYDGDEHDVIERREELAATGELTEESDED